MTALSGIGTGGSTCNVETKDFPAIPFDNSHFHETCSITNDQDEANLRNCELNGLRDLDHVINQIFISIFSFN